MFVARRILAMQSPRPLWRRQAAEAVIQLRSEALKNP